MDLPVHEVPPRTSSRPTQKDDKDELHNKERERQAPNMMDGYP